MLDQQKLCKKLLPVFFFFWCQLGSNVNNIHILRDVTITGTLTFIKRGGDTEMSHPFVVVWFALKLLHPFKNWPHKKYLFIFRGFACEQQITHPIHPKFSFTNKCTGCAIVVLIARWTLHKIRQIQGQRQFYYLLNQHGLGLLVAAGCSASFMLNCQPGQELLLKKISFSCF